MKRIIIAITCIAFSCAQKETKKEIELPPIPETPVREVSEVLYGTEVKDPYRYLEDLKKPEIEAWYKAQSDRARFVLNAISGRENMLKQMFDFDKRKAAKVFNLNISENNRYFYLKQTPADETGKLFYRDGYEGAETLLFDPETYDPASKLMYVISDHYPSQDGKKIAFEIAPNGSESAVLLIMDVTKKTLYPEKIDRCWFASCSWLPDGNSFLFNRLQSSDVHDIDREKNSKVYLHNVGQDMSGDKEVFSRTHNPELDIKPEEIPVVYFDQDAKYIFGFSYSVDNRIKAWYAPDSELKKSKINWKKLFASEDEVYNFVATDKEIFAYTPKGAPRFKILQMPISNPDLTKATVAVPEFKDRTITEMVVNSEGLYFSTTKNGVEAALYHKPPKGEAKEIKLPVAAGRANISSRDFKHNDLWVTLAGWTMDGKRYRYLSDIGEFKPELLSSAADYPEYDNLTVEEVMVKSHDGTEVPLSLIYNKDLKRDGSNPVFMLGYGAYGFSINPFFSPEFFLWTANGGIFAVAHVRGGGELGDKWYKAGHKTTKPNTWKDLIASAEYLIAQNYTSPKKIAINGGSAGGILIGRAMTERPDLFAVAIPEVGCLNPLRAEESPNGPVNVPEFGTVKDSIEFLALMEMDSYLHVKDGENYPATLVTAGINDPRVIAWQPGKFAARLQAASASGEPVLFLADFNAGHGIGDSKSKQYESLSDILTFAFWQTDHPDFQISKLPVYKDGKIEREITVQ
jgi:prolyl oligopeptidase